MKKDVKVLDEQELHEKELLMKNVLVDEHDECYEDVDVHDECYEHLDEHVDGYVVVEGLEDDGQDKYLVKVLVCTLLLGMELNEELDMDQVGELGDG